MPPTSLISALLAAASYHTACDRQTSAFVNVPASSGLQPKHRPHTRTDSCTTKLKSPFEILARGGWAVSPPNTTDDSTAAATGVASESKNEPQEEDDILESEGDFDEPFPMWSGMSAFEEGEAETPPAGVIIVDPFCDYLGRRCQKILEEAGYAVVQVLSDHVLSAVMTNEGAKIFRAPKAGEEVAWAAFLPFPPVAVLCESDAGLATAERLSAALLGPRFGGINEARRDKYLMNEAVRKAGLAAVRQVKTGDWSEVRRFLSNLGNDSESSPPREKSPAHDAGTPCTMEHDPPKGEVLVGARLVALDGHTAPTCHHDHTLRGPETSWAKETVERDRHGYSADAGCLDSVTCVVKPARGCASGGVFLCRGEGEAEEAFKKVLGSPKYATPGAVNTEVLVQEYLEGIEYVVDTVSRDGEHKVMAIWKYDKRPANGAPFVYFATKLMASDGDDEKIVMEYARAALDALGIKYGPTHTEVMMVDAARAGGEENGPSPTKRGTPFLVEVNTRWHLTDFAPITDSCVGYNAVDETLSAYVNPERFDSLPRDPPTGAWSRHGRVVHLVSYVAGKLEAIRHEEEIRRMESFVGIDVYADPERGGTGQVKKTIDIRSDAGWVHLVHQDLDVLDRDYRRVVELMPTMLKVSQAVEAEGDPGV